MPDYSRDGGGTVHLLAPWAGGEDTFCGRNATDGIPEEGGFSGRPSSGPATCAECRAAVEAIRKALRGVRWRV